MSAIDKNVIEVTDPEAAERLMEIMEGESHPLPIKKKDMVEVVRCRDCEYFRPIDQFFGECLHLPNELVIDINWFCADGERRSE